MTTGTANSQFEWAPCPAGCPLCESGVSHTTVRRKENLAPFSQTTKFSQSAQSDKSFGTHISEVVDLLVEWWLEKRKA